MQDIPKQVALIIPTDPQMITRLNAFLFMSPMQLAVQMQ